jgi:hypothetical protein
MTEAPESSANGPGAPRAAGTPDPAAATSPDQAIQAIGRADPYLKSMLLGLIEDSFLHTGTFTQFAAEILQVIAYAATVPVAFTEGFLRAYLSIDRIEETDEGQIKIVPKVGASEEDWIRDVDAITAQVDPSAVFNPVVRSKLTAVHEASSKVMKYDLNTLTSMDDGQLMDVLRQMQQESEELSQHEAAPGTVDSSRDYIRAKLDTIRKNVRAFQAQQRHSDDVVDEGLNEFDDEGLSELDDPSSGAAGDPPPA